LQHVARQEKWYGKLPDGDIKYQEMGCLSRLRSAIESGDVEAIAWAEHDELLERQHVQDVREDLQRQLDEQIKRRGKYKPEVDKLRRAYDKQKESLSKPRKELAPPRPPEGIDYGGSDWQDYQIELGEYHQELDNEMRELEVLEIELEVASLHLSDAEEWISRLRERLTQPQED